jgi:hypothetical protein
MPDLIPQSAAEALQSSLKPSESTATLPGAADGGTNLSAGFAATLPQTTSQRDLLRSMEAAASSSSAADGGNGAGGVTGVKFGDAARGVQDAASAVAASWTSGIQNLKLGDVTSKLTEGAYSMVGKFSASGGPFGKLAAGATSFFGLGGPKEIGKTGAGALTAAQKSATAAGNLGQASAAQTNAAQQANKEDTSYLVTLTDNEGASVIFRVLPEIVENRSVEYEAVQPPQFPGAFQKYKGTASVQWSVNAIFVCRTTDEATENLKYLNRLRGWTMPYFGEMMATTEKFKAKVGAPPPVLKFQGLRTNIIGPVPVVITSLNWNWPRDVDYIPARKLSAPDYDSMAIEPDEDSGDPTVPFPAVMSVAIQLVESFSISEFNAFDLAAYRAGDFKSAYVMNPTLSQADVVQQSTSQEAQAPPGGAFRGIRSDALPRDPNRIYPFQTTLSKSAGAGRGVVIPPVPDAISEAKSIDDSSWRGRGLSGKRWTTKM